MRAIAYIIAGMLGVVTSAQVFLPHRHAISGVTATSSVTPSNFSNLAWWWVAEDLPSTNYVTNWVDRIRGAVWANSVGTTCPTNATTNGVHFIGASNQVLTGSITVTSATNPGNTNVTMFAIVRRAGTGAQQSIISQNNGGNKVWMYNSSAPTPGWEMNASGTHYIMVGNAAGTSWFDMAFESTRTPSDQTIAYTNGVPAVTNAAYIINGSQDFTQVGYTFLQPMDGYIREILIYTNTLGQSTIAQLHNYATNKYGYTP